MMPLRIFIGFDQAEAVAYHTLCHSILSRASAPVSIIPIKRSLLKGLHTRKIDSKQSNEFAFTRWLVPYLSGYEGFSVFMDCDMLVTTDIVELFDLADPSFAVQVVKHDYVPHDKVKYLDTIQYPYEKKNWSSVVLFNNDACRSLSTGYVDQATGLELHQFKWLQNDKLIGELPAEWNHLVGEYPKTDKLPKLIHYTVGGPYFNEFEHVDYAEEWFSERAQMTACLQRQRPEDEA